MFPAGLTLVAFAALATDPSVVRPERPVVDTVEVRRVVVTVRPDAKASALHGACDALSPRDLEATIDGKPAEVVAVDRVARPRMYWLILDTSGSTGDRGQRKLAKEEAARYAREVLVAGRDAAMVLTIDEDLRRVAGPSDDPEATARAIETVPPGAQSLITDALDEVLAQIAADRREQSPGLSLDAAREAAEASPFGRSARASIDRPGDADLRRTIGAWLGDISAHDLFLGWERATIDRRLRGEAVPGPFEARWSALRRWFALPEHARTIVPLVPMRDPSRDVMGFWRVLLPRAYWIAARREGSRGGDPIPYDHVPTLPLAWWLLDTLPESHPEVAARLAGGGWRVAELDYAPSGRLWKEDPAKPYSRAEVLVVLESGEQRLTLQARIDAGSDGPVLAALDVRF